jgi:hypothetical protein
MGNLRRLSARFRGEHIPRVLREHHQARSRPGRRHAGRTVQVAAAGRLNTPRAGASNT